jgi:TonB family protein
MPRCAKQSLRVCAAAVLCVAITLATHAQIPPAQPQPAAALSAAVAKTSAVLAQMHFKKVVVFDFAGATDTSLDRADQVLAASFRAQLEQATPRPFKQVKRDELEDLMRSHDVQQDDLLSTDVAKWMLHKPKIDAWVMATLAAKSDGVHISITTYGTKDASSFGTIETVVPFTGDLRALIDPPTPSPLAGLPVAGAHGYATIRCITCPQARYSDAAVKARLQGTVTLEAAVGPDGRATEFFVLRRMPLGLTQEAIDCVRGWQFSRPTGPDREPATVVQVIEVQFHLY